MLTAIICIAAENSAVPNVRTVSMQQVSGYTLNNQFIDLTNCSFDDSEFDVTITDHDSLVSIVFPKRRYDFAMHNDTVLMLCDETRDMRMSFPSGISIAFNGIDSHRGADVDASGRYRQALSLCGEINAAVSIPRSIDLITAEGDTLPDIRLDHFVRSMKYAICADSSQTLASTPDSLIISSVTDTQLFTAVDEDFPRVIRIKSTAIGNKSLLTDSATYILRSPAAKLTASRHKARPQKTAVHGQSADGSSMFLSQDGESVTVVPSVSQAELQLVISDVAGRLFLSKKISSSDQSVTDVTFLPKGEYMIQLLSDGQANAVIKYVRP